MIKISTDDLEHIIFAIVFIFQLGNSIFATFREAILTKDNMIRGNGVEALLVTFVIRMKVSHICCSIAV
jgi:hypothetical protein